MGRNRKSERRQRQKVKWAETESQTDTKDRINWVETECLMGRNRKLND